MREVFSVVFLDMMNIHLTVFRHLSMIIIHLRYHTFVDILSGNAFEILAQLL